MNLLNQCIFMGRLAADPELKKTLNGKDCCSFRLAVYRDYTDKDNNRPVDWLDFVAWNGTAEFVRRNFRKGQMVAVIAAARVRMYEWNGEKRSAVEFEAESVYFAGSKVAADKEEVREDESV